MLMKTLSMSERLACKALGLARCAYRNLPMAQTPNDPDAELRAWLRAYATKHPCHRFRRAWAALRYNERREVNKKKIHRLWGEEGLQVKVTSPRKRAECPRPADRRRRGERGVGDRFPIRLHD
jgi:putative transposase